MAVPQKRQCFYFNCHTVIDPNLELCQFLFQAVIGATFLRQELLALLQLVRGRFQYLLVLLDTCLTVLQPQHFFRESLLQLDLKEMMGKKWILT